MHKVKNESSALADKECFELIVTSDEDCKNWFQIIDDSRFWIEGIAIPVVGIVGLVGNCLVVVVLSLLIRNNSESITQRNFDVTLLALTIIDFILLLIYMIDSVIQNSYNKENSPELFTEPGWYQVRNNYGTCNGFLLVV